MKINFRIENQEVTPSGNWNTASMFFPEVDVNQETGEVKIVSLYSRGRQQKASIDTLNIQATLSTDQTQLLITGCVDCRNWKNYKTSGSQNFVFAVFVGDTNHIYVHRAPATKGWMKCNPNTIRKRLVKLGIGAITGVLQQGDFLLKPANGSSLPVDTFKHEWQSASHHKFDQPVLSQYVNGKGRFIYIPDNCTIELHHYATDGIQHPTITVPSGQWIIGSTANQLEHNNRRD